MCFAVVVFLFFLGSCIEGIEGPGTPGIEGIEGIEGLALPIIYVFHVSPAVCQRQGIPRYIIHTLEQAVLTQPLSRVLLASNFVECPAAQAEASLVPGVVLVDTVNISSARTTEFLNSSMDIFQTDGYGELWITSATRFLHIEDTMRHLNLSEAFHVEADNLLYGSLTQLVPSFRRHYRGLAATPLTANKVFMTASLLWIPTLASLEQFNDFLLALARPKEAPYSSYVDWLRPKACCRWGGPGHPRDENGTLLQGATGIKPFMINEMTIMAYYQALNRSHLESLPVVPMAEYYLNRWVCNMSEFGPHGREVGPPLRDLMSRSATPPAPARDYVFDPNSYGQFLGGTSKQKVKGYKDIAHIVGQAMRTTGCAVEMLCGNASDMYRWWNITEGTYVAAASKGSAGAPLCYTAPFTHCGEQPLNNTAPVWTAVVNLHVHSKNTREFVSQPCPCL